MEEKPNEKPLYSWEIKVEVPRDDLLAIKNKIIAWARLIDNIAGDDDYIDQPTMQQLYLISDAMLASVNENYDEERCDEIWDAVEEEKIVSK